MTGSHGTVAGTRAIRPRQRVWSAWHARVECLPRPQGGTRDQDSTILDPWAMA